MEDVCLHEGASMGIQRLLKTLARRRQFDLWNIELHLGIHRML
jgi:hypothetical protein